MITLRPGDARGHANHGWLDSYHTFSFANYHDERYMGFRHLRVINEDRVQPGKGFATHAHDNMEIVTYILAGALEHKDSLGTGSVIYPHEVQRMSAGTGITHSEFNHSKSEVVHLLQIWLLPAARGMTPSYEQKLFPPAEKRGRLRLVGAPDGRDGAVTIHQDVFLFATLLEAGEEAAHTLGAGRHAWVQVTRGDIALNGRRMTAGDGAAVSEEPQLLLQATSSSEALVFDLA